MAAINQEAIQELNLVLDTIMPDALAPGVERFTTVSIQSIAPTGIGGFIEPNPSGNAYIHGRRIEARYAVILQGNNIANLRSASNTIIEAFMGAEDALLKQNGVLKIAHTGNAYEALQGATRQLTLTFDLVYEYQQLPEESEEIIEEIPIHLSLEDQG